MLRIGLIGCGYWGKNYLRIVNESPECIMKYCCDLNSETLSKYSIKNTEIKKTVDYYDLLNDDSLDAIIISTPTKTHYQLAKEALKAGKHVLVEKPLTKNSFEAQALVDLAKDKNKILMVGHIFEFNPAVNKIKEYLENHEFGEIYYFYFNRTGLGPIREDVSALWDLVPHDVSILLYLLEKKPESVIASGSAYLQNGIEDVVFLTLKFKGNLIANIHASWLDPYKIRKMTMVGEKKMLVFDDTSNETLKIFDRGAGPVESESFASFKTQIWDGDILIPKIKFVEPLKAEFSYFINCIKTGKIQKSSPEDGYNVVNIIESAQKSIEIGKTVKIDWSKKK